MDFGQVLGRAWEITWRYKMLWVLGFLAALGEGGSVPQSTYSFGDQDFQRFFYSPDFRFYSEALAAITAAIFTILCIVVIIAIIIWVISVIARGGLIAAAQQIEEEGSTSFGRAWAVSARKFWTLFGLSVLTLLPMIILGILLAVAAVLFFVPVSQTVGPSADRVAAGSIIIFVICSGLLCCGGIFLALILGQVRIYGERAAIIEDANWISAFSRGWEVIKENLGATIILWLIFLAIGIVVFAVSAAIAVALAAPFVGMFFATEPGYWWIAPVCIGGLLGIIIFALIRSIVTTYTSATWTLAFRQMTMGQEVDLIPAGES
jgi:hypothetical protein